MLQYGEINMITVPAHLDWYEPGDEEEKRTQCRVTVRDGQNNLINNEVIYFTSDLGDPTDEDIHPVIEDITDPDVLEAYTWDDINEDGWHETGTTGWYEGECGRLYKYVIFQKDDCPPPVPVPPGMVSSAITASIIDCGLSVTQSITLYRYTD